ncbi:hypothetical protein [Actinomadura atramentaria]|uniref:hypothetical protein n=1 Tax=Actinomadura atramentaria TaxID=1990 RepID=UPI00039A369F|nr:hypothetical protein [Actinomadura atramentaria]
MAGQRRLPITNTALKAAMTAAALPYARIAEVINLVGHENGVPLYYGRSTVAHWLTGTTPRPESIAVVVEAFARLLDRPDLTAGDLGWSHAEPARPDDPWDGDPVAWLTRLGKDDMLDRRSLLRGSLYSLTALGLPAPPWPAPARSGTPRRTGASDVARVEEMTSRFAAADDLFGGGHARTAVAAYLVNDVVPMLHGSSGRARPALFAAAARLAYLAGFMNADAGHAGQAQRYYVQSARLGREADDVVAQATALRALALQASELDHPAQAVELAESAAATLNDRADTRIRAWMQGMLAEAHAANGEGRQALGRLRQAEALVERADSTPASEWTGGYGREALEHQTGSILMRLADPRAAEEHFRLSIVSRPPNERRSKVLITARLATAQLRDGHPEKSARTVLGIRDDIALVSSHRAVRHFRELRTGWARARSESVVQRADDFLVRAVSG